MSLYQAWKRQNRTGYQFKTQEYLNYMDRSVSALDIQKLILKENQAYAVEIFLLSSTWLTKKNQIKKKDLDNYLKVILDTVVRYCDVVGYNFDDSQVVELMVKKIYDKTQEKAVIRFTECNFP